MANMRYRATEVPKETPADALIERLRAACLARGANGIKTFATSFQIMDDSRDLKLDRSELSKALHDYKVKYINEEFEDLFKQFDTDGSGNISFDEFLLRLRVNDCVFIFNERKRKPITVCFLVMMNSHQ
jgi:hypothetical protein